MPKNGGSGQTAIEGRGQAAVGAGSVPPPGGPGPNNRHEGFDFKAMADEFLADLRHAKATGGLDKFSTGWVSGNVDFFAGLSQRDAQSYYRKATRLLHPDAGGSHKAQSELATAYARIRKSGFHG